MSRTDNASSYESVRALLAVVAPGSTLVALGPLDGSYSNVTYRVDALAADGTPLRLVTRRYRVFGDYDRGAKARREFRALELARAWGVPVPEPVYLDDAGALLGSPGIVTAFAPGRLVLAAPHPRGWARVLAETLARVHSTPCDAAAARLLLAADDEALWFLRSGETMPAFMSAHPLGKSVWESVRLASSRTRAAPPALVHVDYWAGNVLWDGDRVSAVVDWEEAAYGNPGIDVAYCRMDMALAGMPDAADEFLAVYESETKRSVTNLGLWELAASVRPMASPAGWIVPAPEGNAPPVVAADAQERFAAFVEGAIRRAGL